MEYENNEELVSLDSGLIKCTMCGKVMTLPEYLQHLRTDHTEYIHTLEENNEEK